MFTGIITAIGTVHETSDKGDLRVIITCPFDPDKISIGASIACSGVCLTVIERGGKAGDAWFSVDASAETLARTVPGMWEAGQRINLEPALKMGDELGGHIVTGHVDAIGQVVKKGQEGASTRLVIEAPKDIAPYIAMKGSIAVDGVSLTVNEVADQPDGAAHFGLNIIPHTADVTTLGALVEGSKVNLEIDLIARYLHRMQSLRS